MDVNVINIVDVKKKYKLGSIGGGTLKGDIQSWWARKRGKEDPNAIIGQDVQKDNTEFWALKGINFSVKKGEAVGIIGTNGAGKSTLLKILSRITAPTEGYLEITGRISSMLEVGTGFHGELTGRENIYLNGAILGMTKSEIDEKLDDIIAFSECAEFIDTPVKRYSSGMYVKLAFSVAAHLNSEILIMDEVLAVGDVAFQKKCLEKMNSISRNENRTILYVSHNMSTIRELCTRCIVLKKGEVVFDGEPEKAIQVYLETENFINSNYFDLKKLDRLERSIHDAFIEEIELLNANNGCIKQGEVLKYRLRWKTYKKIERVKIRMTFSDKLGNHMATSLSNEINCLDEDKIYEGEFMADISNLVAGKYLCYIGIYNTNAVGRFEEQDLVDRPFYFEIIENDMCQHPKEWWDYSGKGYVRFNDIKLISLQNGKIH